MAVVGIKELKNRLTEYLRRTRQGDEIVVTDRGKPIAIIQALEHARQVSSLEGRLAKLDAQGVVTAPTRLPLRRVKRARASGRLLSQLVVDDRR
jgi:prevent-host-death family protein